MPEYAAYDIVFETPDAPVGLLRVRRMQIEEIISKHSLCDLELVCDEGNISSKQMVGATGMVTIARADGSVARRFAGVIREVTEFASTNVGRQRLDVRLVDPLAMLEYSTDHRIFQEKTSRQIVETIFADAGIPTDALVFRLAADPPKRTTCTQYGETMRAFVERVLQEDGIAWFVQHSEEGGKLVFADGPSGFDSSDLKLPLREAEGLVSGEAATRLRERARVHPAKVTLRDHDFTKPSLDLTVAAEGEHALAREDYMYPGGFFDSKLGNARAKALLDAYAADGKRLFLTGHALSLVVGQAFDLEETPAGLHDGAFVPVAVRHLWVHGAGDVPDRIETSAELLAEGVRFAPLPVPRPSPRSAMANVTVPAGEEIHCDEHGRIKVQFHWDRYGAQDDKSSGFVRVGQVHTSGSVVIPRKAWEVLIEFEDGDPERPIAVGRVYNAAMPPTDSLPGGKTNSVLRSYVTPGSGGHNEIRMNDGGGKELTHVHAQKDLNLVVANDKKEKVGTSASIGVAVDQTVSVGSSQTEKVGTDEQVTVGGSQTHTVGASRTKTVSGTETHSVHGARSVSIGGNHTTMTPMADSVSSSGSLTETVGGMCLEVAALGVGVAVAGSTSISVGAAKIEAVAAGKDDMTVGARATAIGGAFLNVTPADIAFNTHGAKVTAVGGAWLGNAGGIAEMSSGASISINVGGAIAANGATILFKVGSSKVEISAGKVVLDAAEVKITSSGPLGELAGAIGSK